MRLINSEEADRRTPLLHGLNDGEESRGRKWSKGSAAGFIKEQRRRGHVTPL